MNQSIERVCGMPALFLSSWWYLFSVFDILRETVDVNFSSHRHSRLFVVHLMMPTPHVLQSTGYERRRRRWVFVLPLSLVGLVVPYALCLCVAVVCLHVSRFMFVQHSLTLCVR